MMVRTPLLSLAALGLAACAETPEQAEAGKAANVIPPAPEDTSARSPMTVNPEPKDRPLPATPPALPQESEKAMPPGPVN